MARIYPADLTGFLAVAKELNFRRAAVALGVTPSALSHAMRTLEERIEVRLVNRTTRSVSLTEAGQRLYDRVRPAFQEVESALDELAQYRGRPMGSLRLNTALSAAQLVLLPLVAGFVRAHPAVNVEIVAQTALVDVVSEGFDAGVRFGETIAADMVAVPIGPRQRFAAVASPGYFQHWPKPVEPRNLTGLPCIRYKFDSGADFHWEFERGGIEVTTAVEGPFTTNAQELMIRAALDGVGIAYVFEGLVRDLIAEGRLVRVLEDWCPYFPGLYLYYPGRRQMPSALRAFIDYARGEGAKG